jgi:predicted ribosome quality control (RQC) complex YloA/Tae2 family protein
MKLHIDELVPHIRNPINEENIIPSGGKLKKVVNKKRKFLKRKRDNIKKDLEKVMLADEIQDWAISIEDEHLPNREVYFKGVKIKLDEAENFYQKRDLIFKKAKSFRAAQGILIKRLEDVSSEFEVLKDDSSVLEIVGQGLKSSLRPTSPAWPQVEAVERKKVSAGVLEGAALYEGTNIKVAIGQSAQANDGLRIKWAKKDDLWFHLEDQTSAHGFLKAEIDTPLTPKLFEVLGSALREHSKTKSDQIDLIYTKVRYLKSIKGKPGLVKFKNEKRIRVDYCEDWKEILANL